jgi:hypothetical protein
MIFNANGYYADLAKMDLSKLTTALTEEEKKSPYARYYSGKPANPDPDVMEAIKPNHAIDPSKAIMPGDVARLVKNHGKTEVENGYCVMPGGTGYATILTRSHDITPEVEKVFESYNPDGDLGYKIWYPGAHIRHLKDGAIEDMGAGIMKINFYAQLPPIAFGIQDLKSLDPDCIGLMGGGGRFKKLNDGEDVPFAYMANIHYSRKVGNGSEMRSFFWNGIRVVNGKTEVFLNPGQMITEEQMRMVAAHCAYEFANNRAVMLQWYRDHKNK